MTREFKDSGIEWIGSIPKDWKVIPHKRVMRKLKEICVSYDGEDIISLTTNGIIVRDLTAGGKMPTSFDGYQYVYPGNLLMCLFDIDVTPRCVGYVRNEGLTSPAYSRFEMFKGVFGPYYDYLLRYMDDEKCLLHLSKNLRSSLTEDDFGQIPTILPSFSEQKSIADFLDKKCAEIDALVDIQEQMIAKLTDYKQSVITEAVTKGLDPDVELVPSGIDWIGDIPKKWSKQRLKYLCTIQTGNKDTQDSDPFGIYPFYVRSPIVEKSNNFSFEGEGILMAGDGAGAGRVFHHVYGKYAVHQRVYRLANIKGVDSNFLFYFLSSLFCKEMDRGSAQSTVPSVRLPMLQNFIVCLPSVHEQKNIVIHLNNKCEEIESLIDYKRQKINALINYKKSVIFEAVTGKIEV